MTRSFPRLSSPFAIGKLTIKNRFVVALGEEATPTKVAECQFGTYAARAVRETSGQARPPLPEAQPLADSVGALPCCPSFQRLWCKSRKLDPFFTSCRIDGAYWPEVANSS